MHKALPDSPSSPDAVFAQAAALRAACAKRPLSPEQIEDALLHMFALWQARLTNGWTPPDGSAFPWEMVRVSVGGLTPPVLTPPPAPPRSGEGSPIPSELPPLPDKAGIETPVGLIGLPSPLRGGAGGGVRTGGVTAIICAGNTPLLAWPALCAALLSGASVFVKMSRHETLWPRLFVESLRDVGANELADRVHLAVWPGVDPRTVALAQAADVVIAYGSDASVAMLRAATPTQTPFFGFGHALSVGLWTASAEGEAMRPFAEGFARDVLMYGQGGCLSPHTIFVEQNPNDAWVSEVCEVLSDAMARVAETLCAPPVTDAAVARALREARDMAHFEGHTVWGDETNLHYGMVIACQEEMEMPPPVGHGVVFVVPIAGARELPERFGTARGKISSVGVAGALSAELRAILRAEGVSRICSAGEMQAPPLTWPNGNIDLFTALPAALRKQK